MIFINNKYQKWYDQLINNAKNRAPMDNEYYETHHIVPKSFLGTDDPENLVKLTAREHFIAHLFLAKIYGGKMIVAAQLMSGNKIYNSKKYGWLREEYCNLLKNSPAWNKGKPLSDHHKKSLSTSLKSTYQNGRSLSPSVFKPNQVPHNAKGKLYYFRSPEGEVYKTDNVTRFCKARNLAPTLMCRIAKRDNVRYHKKWSLAEPSEFAISEFYNILQLDPTISDNSEKIHLPQ